MRVLIAPLLIALSGCQSAEAEYEQFSASAMPYTRCVINKAREIAHTQEDPYYLSLAAKSYCATERSKMVSDFMKQYPYPTWETHADEVDKIAEDLAIKAIVRERISQS